MLKELVIASNNLGKIEEIKSLLSPLGIKIYPQKDFTDDEIEETCKTFIENAILKARYLSKISGLPALADDSGLVVPSLNGEPGIYSARYAGEHGNDIKNYNLLLEKLAGKTNRQAYFVCVLSLCFSETHPLPIITEGRWEGEIALNPAGKNGFGYDPVFYIPNLNKTSAQLTKQEKNKLSHRSKAFGKLLKAIQ